MVSVGKAVTPISCALSLCIGGDRKIGSIVEQTRQCGAPRRGPQWIRDSPAKCGAIRKFLTNIKEAFTFPS